MTDFDTPFFLNLESNKAGRMILNMITNNKKYIIEELHYPMYEKMTPLLNPFIQTGVASYFDGTGHKIIESTVENKLRKIFGAECKKHEENIRSIIADGEKRLISSTNKIIENKNKEFESKCSAHIAKVLSQPENQTLIKTHLEGYDDSFYKWKQEKSKEITKTTKNIASLNNSFDAFRASQIKSNNSFDSFRAGQTVFDCVTVAAVASTAYYVTYIK